jgi:hypothetical protein
MTDCICFWWTDWMNLFQNKTFWLLIRDIFTKDWNNLFQKNIWISDWRSFRFHQKLGFIWSKTFDEILSRCFFCHPFDASLRRFFDAFWCCSNDVMFGLLKLRKNVIFSSEKKINTMILHRSLGRKTTFEGN